MKSVKPGRGPSMLTGIVGIFMICVGIVWTVIASQASGFFALFGVFWTLMAAAITIYHFKNATSRNRYSQFDITDGGEEPDPLNQRFGGLGDEQEVYREPSYSQPGNSSTFCPYCGTPVAGDYEFCNKCGRELP